MRDVCLCGDSERWPTEGGSRCVRERFQSRGAITGCLCLAAHSVELKAVNATLSSHMLMPLALGE